MRIPVIHKPHSCRPWRALAAALILLLPAGCTLLQPRPSSAVDEVTGARWYLDGKLGVRSERGSANLRIRWTQEDDHYLIELDSMLGQGVARISGDTDAVVLEVSGEAPVTSASVDALTEQVLGWRLPAGDVLYWLRAVPAPGAPFQQQRGADDHLAELQQSGWQVRYDAYEGMLPTRIRFRGDGVELRLVVRQWARSAPT